MFCLSAGLPASGASAYAEEDNEPAVILVVDGEVFASVPVVDGQFTLPQEVPQKEGCEFYGWSDGFARYEAGKTYSVSVSMTLNAVWKEQPVVQTPNPFFNKGEKIAFWGMVAVLCLLFLFSYYWFGIKNYSLRQLKQKILTFFKHK